MSLSLRYFRFVMIPALVPVIAALFLSAAMPSSSYAADDDALVIKYEAQEAVRELEIDIDTMRHYPAEKRLREELNLGKQMQRLERKYQGYKANNRILYLLADWQVTYDIEKAPETIQTLKNSVFSANKGTLDIVRIRYALKTGDTKQARTLVNAITERIPELQSVSDLVSLYERRGEDAPHIDGNNLGGGSKDPLKTSTEPFLLYYFVELTDDWQVLHFKEFTEELQRKPYHDKFKIVCVCFDSKYISALATWNKLSKNTNWELLWANPSPKGDAQNWKDTWGVHSLPNAVLVGIDRKILDINPRIQDLQILAGEDPKTDFSNAPSLEDVYKGPRKGPRWR